MPSKLHEVLIAMFRDRPALAAELLRGPLQVEVPAFHEARLTSGDLTDIKPTEYRADAVVTLDNDNGPTLAVVVEVQLRSDPRKRLTWPVYVTTLHARLGCPVVLLVVCPQQAVADWCAAPVAIGPPGSVLTPVALGPAQVPLVTDPAEARHNPELTVLSAMAHGARPNPVPVFEALFTALHALDPDHADLYTDLMFTVLPAAARNCLEDFMTTTSHRYQSEFARRYFDQGEAQGEARGRAMGEAQAVLMVLDVRGVEIPEDIRTGIAGCTDLDQLARWLRQAVTAEKIEELDPVNAG